jgi:hypothetical protein
MTRRLNFESGSEQGRRVCGVGWEHRDADAQPDADLVPAHLDIAAGRIEQALDERLRGRQLRARRW